MLLIWETFFFNIKAYSEINKIQSKKITRKNAPDPRIVKFKSSMFFLLEERNIVNKITNILSSTLLKKYLR